MVKKSLGTGFSLLSAYPLTVLAVVSHPCAAATLTFSDQDGGTGSMERNLSTVGANVYNSAQGLSPGMTATFQGFNRYGAADASHSDLADLLQYDHTGNVDWRAIYGISDTATLTFNLPVSIDSLWFDNVQSGFAPDPSNNDPGYTLQITAMDLNQIAWSYTYTWEFDQTGNYILVDAFQQVTTGAGKTVDELIFNDVGDCAIDDITVNSVPEPMLLGYVLTSIFLLAFSRKNKLKSVKSNFS